MQTITMPNPGITSDEIRDEMNQRSTPVAELRFTDNILSVRFNEGAHLDLDSLRQLSTLSDELVGENKYGELIGGYEQCTISNEARNYLPADSSANKLAIAVVESNAIAVQNRFLFVRSDSTITPVRSFQSEALAKKWLMSILEGQDLHTQAGDTTDTPLLFQVQLLKQNCAIAIFHLESGKFIYSHGVQQLFGCKGADFSTTSFRVSIHPEDQEIVGTITSISEDFAIDVSGASDCRLSIIYRAEKKDYGYIRILQQTSAYECNADGKVISCLIVFSDISFAPGMHAVSWNFEGPAEIQEAFTRMLHQNTSPVFSGREMEILRLLNLGLSSDEIAKKLFISRHTVDTHRRRMLKKVNSTGTLAMLQHCRKVGLLT